MGAMKKREKKILIILILLLHSYSFYAYEFMTIKTKKRKKKLLIEIHSTLTLKVAHLLLRAGWESHWRWLLEASTDDDALKQPLRVESIFLLLSREVAEKLFACRAYIARRFIHFQLYNSRRFGSF